MYFKVSSSSLCLPQYYSKSIVFPFSLEDCWSQKNFKQSLGTVLEGKEIISRYEVASDCLDKVLLHICDRNYSVPTFSWIKTGDFIITRRIWGFSRLWSSASKQYCRTSLKIFLYKMCFLPCCSTCKEQYSLHFLVVEEIVERPEASFLTIRVWVKIRIVARHK